ncbi:hypothetical protein VN97_g10053 [Penicillium thymicola]|uniref:Uncharacterized protein n=1 Tax=Penicillium thymicola TaxID=293382 RepID=A0AAI9X4B3_PENTH|nr:hypothetical protein VN97_g10053 [Penicillium thymicola]
MSDYHLYYEFCRAVTIRQAHAKPARSQREGSSFLRRRIPTASFHLFFVSHFLPEFPLPPRLCPSSRPTFSRSFSSLSQALHISLSAPAEPRTLSHFCYTSRFPAVSRRLVSFFRAFLLSSSIDCIGASSISYLKRGKHEQFPF